MDNSARMTDRNCVPDDAQLSEWIGASAYSYWNAISGYIDKYYPGIFGPEWLYGGKKHGWSLRYKKNKSFCTLIPEKGKCQVLIVFGAEERSKAEAILSELSPEVRTGYEEATTYHDGKWLVIDVISEELLADVFRLFAIKRKIKIK